MQVDMENAEPASFYRGWIIQITQDGEGYRSVCFSPSRQKISSKAAYLQKKFALCSAKAAIDRQFACHQLVQAVRDLYEDGRISFEDWRSLTQSLLNRSPA